MPHERVLVQPTASTPEARHRLVDWARRRGFRRFVLASDEATAEEAPGYTAEAGRFVAHRSSDRPAVVPLFSVGTPEELSAALRAGEASGALAVRWSGDRVIPLENAVAAAAGRFTLWLVTSRAADVPTALGALERGVEAVVFEASRPEDITELEGALETPSGPPLAWHATEVAEVRPAGVGDRVIVDTTSVLAPDEGFLVGSSAALLFHVRSEAEGSAFSRPRPFRVNAGAAHLYVLMADGSTRYLAELLPGEAVLASRPNGPSRAVRVGRLKTERRPLVHVGVDEAGRRRHVFVQEAETVRLSGPKGPVPSTEVAPGGPLWVVAQPQGRHLGRVVEETVEER